MKILIVGGGAREHALAYTLAKDPSVTELHCAPGNPGIAAVATLHAADQNDGAEIAALATVLGADLVVVGPEAPLVAGVADAVRAAGIPVFGPNADAAQLEGSKAFAKEVMNAANVPTAGARVCTTQSELAAALNEFAAPHVVKDDGLAAGKGVVVTDDLDTALAHGDAVLAGGHNVVIEEFLDGPEVSLFCICDGTTVIPLEPAQDFKRAYDGDEGLNTGGMGAYSPLPWAPPGLVSEVVRQVAQPTVDEMAKRGTPFVGVLYCGLALTAKGTRVIEFNARFGDPETQSVLARLETPLAGLLMAAAKGELASFPALKWSKEASVTVVLAAHGYPVEVRSGDPIIGVDNANAQEGTHVLHAGTALNAEGQLVSSGGRVLSVVAVGEDLGYARDLAYAGLDLISLDGSHHRSDIALTASMMETE